MAAQLPIPGVPMFNLLPRELRVKVYEFLGVGPTIVFMFTKDFQYRSPHSVVWVCNTQLLKMQLLSRLTNAEVNAIAARLPIELEVDKRISLARARRQLLPNQFARVTDIRISFLQPRILQTSNYDHHKAMKDYYSRCLGLADQKIATSLPSGLTKITLIAEGGKYDSAVVNAIGFLANRLLAHPNLHYVQEVEKGPKALVFEVVS